MKRICLYIIILSVVFCLGENDGYCQERDFELKNLIDTLQSRLNQLQKDEHFPGVTLGVVLPNGQRLDLAAGFADIESQAPMPVNARIFPGSIGKTFVATVALQLIAEGKFSLEDKISYFFKGEKWFTRLPNANDITVRMIMNHTGGLPRYVLKEEFWKKLRDNPDHVWKPVEQLAFIFDEKPVHPAGKGWSYSDTDYLILGMIIEKVTGNTYYNELQKRVLTPLRLGKTGPAVDRQWEGMVQGYTGKNIPPLNLPEKVVVNGKLVVSPQFEWCGGGLISTAGDLAFFIHQLLEGHLIPGKYLELMKQPVDENNGQPSQTGYGLGLEVWETPEGIAYGHRGTMIGCISICEYIPKHRFSIALQVNTDSFSGRLEKNRTRNDYINALKPLIIQYLIKAGR